jgi:hypothetical protein
MTISNINGAIEIDHVDRDLSAALRNGVIEIGIGEGYGEGPGGSYARWTDIYLTINEARAFRDWLTSKIETES